MASKENYVTLISAEGVGFKVEEKVVAAMKSQPINNCLTTPTPPFSSSSSRVILLPRIKAKTLLVLIDYSTNRANRELIDQDMMDRLRGPLFFDVFAAAKDLGMHGLLLVLYFSAHDGLRPASFEVVKRFLDDWYLELNDGVDSDGGDSELAQRVLKSRPVRKFLGCMMVH